MATLGVKRQMSGFFCDQPRTIPYPISLKVVLDNLSSCNIAHFACHGVSMLKNTCNSHLLLPGPGETEADLLRIEELANRNLERSMLAYLSACHTANYTSETLLDEGIHIASAFQLAGFPHVIGTLWEASDLKAREVATEFYKTFSTLWIPGAVLGMGLLRGHCTRQ